MRQLSPETKIAVERLVLYSTAVVLRLDLATKEADGSYMCSALREPLRTAVIEMRRVLEE